MKVTLSNYDVITLDALFNKSENILNNPEKFLSIKFLWALENNVSKIREAANNIRDFKQKIDEQYRQYAFRLQYLRSRLYLL